MPPSSSLLTRPFVLAVLTTLGAFLMIGMLLPVLPVYAKGPLGEGSVGVGLAVAAASPTALLVQPFAGRLGDRRGRRVLVISGLSSWPSRRPPTRSRTTSGRSSLSAS